VITEIYYFYQVENTLFRTPVGILILHSEMIRGLIGFTQSPITLDQTEDFTSQAASTQPQSLDSQPLRIPYPEKEGDEGSRSNPIFIQSLTADGFAGVLSWIWSLYVMCNLVSFLISHYWQYYRHTDDPTTSAPKLIDIIESSRFLMIPRCARWAINKLKIIQPSLSPIQKLKLSQRYPIFDADWIDPAVAALVVEGPVLSIGRTEDILSELPSRVIHILTAAHVTLIQERIRLAQSIITVGPSPFCDETKHQTVCHPYWVNIWWNTIARRLLHPKTPIAVSEAPNLARSTIRGEPGGTEMDVSCKMKYINEVEHSGALNFEDDVISGATQAIKVFLQAGHMCITEFDVPPVNRLD
jgi:hypothetical protein